MSRPKVSDLSIEDRIEAQTLKWIKIADKAAAIADLQLDGFLAQVRDGAIGMEGHVQIATVLKDVLGAAKGTIETGLKTLAARREDNGSTAPAQSREALLEELHGKG